MRNSIKRLTGAVQKRVDTNAEVSVRQDAATLGVQLLSDLFRILLQITKYNKPVHFRLDLNKRGNKTSLCLVRIGQENLTTHRFKNYRGVH